MLRTTNGFAGYTDPGLLAKGNYIVARMTDNDYYPTPVPSVADVKEVVARYAEALNGAATRSIQAVANKTAVKAELVTVLRSLGNYVTATANGDAEILATSGYDSTKPSTPTPPLQTPPAPVMRLGAGAGSLRVSTEKQKGVVITQFLLTDDLSAPLDKWIILFSSKSSRVFINLKSATRYYGKVCQIGRDDDSVESPTSTYVTQ